MDNGTDLAATIDQDPIPTGQKTDNKTQVNLMLDGLHLYGEWVAMVSVPITKQANDLTNPTQIQATYANVFQLPDTQAIRTLLENAEQIDAGGKDPYQLIPAKLIDEGEVTFSGFATLLSHQGGWKVSLVPAFKSLFDQLSDSRLSDLDLTKYNHPWTLETIAKFSKNTEGIVYPAIDYGSVTSGIFAQDTLLPGIFAKSLVDAMLLKAGYRATGGWLTDKLYNAIVLPFVESDPQSHDDDWRIARQARVTVTGVIFIPPRKDFDDIIRYNRDNEPLNNWIDGKQNNYKADTCRYVCDVPMRLRVTAYQRFAIKVDFGAAEAMLIIEKNGQNVYQEYQDYGGPYNLTMNGTENLNLDTHIDCLAGDQIQIRFILRKKTFIAQIERLGFISEENTWASFEPDVAIKNGDIWPVAINMPDMSCTDLLKTVALKCLGTFEVDEVARTVTLHTLNEVMANDANTQDLSHCIEEGTEPENAVVIPPYGQKNLLKWRALEDKTLAGYGDGVITCNAQNIPSSTILFELPFTAVVDSKNSIAGYGTLPFIETRTISGTGSSVQVQRKKAQPCLVLVEPTKPVTVVVNQIMPDLSVQPTSIPLSACWWHTRPIGLVTPNNNFSLAFDRPMGTSGREQTLIQRYFQPLTRILRRPRQLTPSVRLSALDFATIDPYAPVRLRQVRAGSLDLNDNLYYLNKVNNYVAGTTCTMSLIPY